MAKYVECNLCGEGLSYEQDDCNSLFFHMLDAHPESYVCYYENFDEACCEESSSKEEAYCGQVYKYKAVRQSKLKKNKLPKKKGHKTTMETWTTGNSVVVCDYCGYEGIPYIRKQKNKVAYTALGAYFLLGCWPFCFLPFMTYGGAMISLYCRNCGTFLGTYNRKSGKLIPPTCNMKEKKIIIRTACSECSTPS